MSTELLSRNICNILHFPTSSFFLKWHLDHSRCTLMKFDKFSVFQKNGCCSYAFQYFPMLILASIRRSMKKQQGTTRKGDENCFSGSFKIFMYCTNNSNKDFLPCSQDGGHCLWLLQGLVWITHSTVYFYLYGLEGVTNLRFSKYLLAAGNY